MELKDAIELLEEVKVLDDSMYQYNPAYLEALDTVIEKARSLNHYAGQLKWERDVAIGQLNEIGIQFGEKMDSVKLAQEKRDPEDEDIRGKDEEKAEGAGCAASCPGNDRGAEYPHKILSFTIPTVIDTTRISDPDADMFVRLLQKAGACPDFNRMIKVSDVLASQEINRMEKDMILDILYRSQERGKILPGMRSGNLGMHGICRDDGNKAEVEKDSAEEDIHEGFWKDSFSISDLFVSSALDRDEISRVIHFVRKSGVKPSPETQEISLQEVIMSENLPECMVDELIYLVGKCFEKNNRRFLMIVTEEDDRYPKKGLSWFGDHPEEGNLVDIVAGDTYEELTRDGRHEGLFYILYNRWTRKKLSYGVIDPDGLEEVLEENR